jgi:D-alanyl-D-alanine carboxypeptidase/D-alanyl-D-alanine-endopeptidase (penicillin-binding protein 4)
VLVLVLVACVAAVPARSGPPEGLARRLDEVLDGPDYKHASWGVLVADAKTGATVYARNPDAMLAPASVTKLFTCAAALVALGPDHTVETAVYQRGPVVKGTLLGDLVLVAAGDLTLGGRTTSDGRVVFRDKDHTYANSGLADAELTDTDPLAGLNALAKQVKDAGVHAVAGEVLVDDRLFDKTRGTGSGPDAVSPVVVNDNVIDVVVEPGPKPGDPARVTARPESAAYHMDAVVTTGDEKSAPAVRLQTVGVNQFAVRGSVPAKGPKVVRIFPVEEPAAVARTMFVEALRRHGVGATAAVLRTNGAALPPRDAVAKLDKVATLTSPPLRDDLRVTLKVSHNLYASTLPCLVAVANGARTAEAGLREERRILKELGVDVNAVSYSAGAGGAAADHVSARATVQLVQGLAKRKDWDDYKRALPVLGVDGTLADVVKPDSPARGKVFAKTGTLVWLDAANGRFLLKSKALAGTMTTKTGAELHFAMMVNNVPLPPGVSASREGKALGRLCELLHDHGP